MSSQPTRPGDSELDDDLKRVLDEHAEYAELDKDYVSREQLMRDGIAKFKHPVPQ